MASTAIKKSSDPRVDGNVAARLVSQFGARSESIAVVSFIGLFAYFGYTLGDIWYGNIPSMLRDISWLGIVAIGQATVIIAGEFDLSVGSVYALIGLIFVLLINHGLPPEIAFIASVAIGVAIGWFNGLVTWRLKLPSLLVTLGFLFVYRGIVYFLTAGETAAIPDVLRDDALLHLLGGQTAGFHNSVYICAALVILGTFVLSRTRFGGHVQAVGGDIQSAAACGVRLGRIKLSAFMISAALAGLAGMVSTAALSSVSPSTADGLEFEAVAACVIGGCSLRGGVGSPWGALLGVATLMALKSGLILQGTNIFIYQVLLGAVLVTLIAIRGMFPRFFAVR